MHSYCMRKYIDHYMEQKRLESQNNACQQKNTQQFAEQRVPCPVCRLSVTFDMDTLKDAPEPQANQVGVTIASLRYF